MKLNQKKKAIFDDITFHYDEFLRQSHIKVDKRFANEPTDHIELVSEVLLSIVDKFDDPEQVDRYYEMVQQNMLFNYIVKSINTNTKSLNAPFLREKLRIRNRTVVSDNLYVEPGKKSEWDLIVDRIYETFEPEAAKRIYGEDWKYYTTIFKEYVENKKCSYEKLSRKYHIPKSNIYRDISEVKRKIRKYLEL